MPSELSNWDFLCKWLKIAFHDAHRGRGWNAGYAPGPKDRVLKPLSPVEIRAWRRRSFVGHRSEREG